MRHFLGADSPIQFSVAKMVRGVFFITTVPVAVGMLLRAWQARWVDQLQNALGRIATTLFVLIVIATFVSQRDALMANLATVGPAAASLNLGVMLVGAGLALAFGLGRRDAIAITSECGLQNAALGIFIATTVLGTPALAVPSVIYALLMNLGAFGLIFVARRWGHPARS
jgi:BASS family bile acid:Na+ symporter